MSPATTSKQHLKTQADSHSFAGDVGVGKFPDYLMQSAKGHEDNLLRYREIYKKMYNDTSFDEFKRTPASAKA